MRCRHTVLTILFVGLLHSLLSVDAAVQEPALPEAIVPDRLIPLFNGKDLSGWKPDVPAKDKDPNAPDSFIVRDAHARQPRRAARTSAHRGVVP